MRKKLLSILVALAVMVTFMPAQTLTVAAASKVKTKATVSTQAGLKKALKNKKLKTLTIKTSKIRNFSIPKGNRKNLKVVVNAEYGTLKVSKNAIIKEVQVAKAGGWNLEVNGKVSKLKVNAKSGITVKGSPTKMISVQFTKKGTGSNVKNNTNSSIQLLYGKDVYLVHQRMTVNVMEDGHFVMSQVDIPVSPGEPEPEDPDTPGTPGGGDIPSPVPGPTPTPEQKDPSFKAVYDTNGDANVLTLYYDKVDHRGSNIKVYDNLPMNASPENWKSPEMPTEDEFWAYEAISNQVKRVVIDPSVADLHGLKSTYMMFYYFTNCSSITGVEYLDVSQVSDMNWMFGSFGAKVENFNCVPDVSKWDTSSLETADHMFYFYGGNSTELSEVPDVSNWDTSNLNLVQDMFSMYGCESKKLQFRLDLTKWNVSKLIYSVYMLDSAGYSVSDDNWQVIIPNKSAGKNNTDKYFYIYDGTYAIHPTGDRVFTVAAEVKEELPEKLPENSTESPATE